MTTKRKENGQSPEQAIDILKTILLVKFKTPYSHKMYEELIINTSEQKKLIAQFSLHTYLG